MNEKSRTAAERARVELSLPIQMITLSASARCVHVVVVVVYVSTAGREFHNAAPRCVVFTFYYLLRVVVVVRVCVSVLVQRLRLCSAKRARSASRVFAKDSWSCSASRVKWVELMFLF